jgi:hypothetical protein
MNHSLRHVSRTTIAPESPLYILLVQFNTLRITPTTVGGKMSSEDAEMKVDPARAAALISQLNGVSERVAALAKGRTVSL